jgi:high affinity Mn2+ porin
MKHLFIAIIIHTCLQNVNAQTKKDSIEKWSYHYQFTAVMQGHPAFKAPYAGNNSLDSIKEQALSITSTLFLGRKLWKGGSVYFNPEIAGGKGMSSALGIAGFTNGECFRIGSPDPALYIARAFIRQHIAIGENEKCTVESTLNQLGGEKVPSSRITITVGKFSIADVFDYNSNSHDPRTHFMNWSLMSNGAWDYPANTRGYTYGFIVELIKPTWAIRISEAMVPQKANGPLLDPNISKALAETIEFEKDFKIKGHKGAVRILAFRNLSRGGNYEKVINQYTSGIDTSLNVNTLTAYGSKKYGIAINAEQNLNEYIGIFVRASWNDGKTATWAFTEIDQSASIGTNINGIKWKRENDVLGIGSVINGISKKHLDFLNIGGYGFMIGDGKLPHYGLETIGEIYYSAQVTKSLWLTADYQYIKNPAYNRDRGPVHVWAIRGHIEF